MRLILKSDLRQLSYAEFADLLEILVKDIQIYLQEKKLYFDLVVPILRSGAFTGLHIASQLRIKNILPVQYKYIYQPEEKIERKFDFPRLNYSLPSSPVILVTDTNTAYGGMAKTVIRDIKEIYPTSKIYFASLDLDYAINSLDNVEHLFWAVRTNAQRTLSKKMTNKLGVEDNILVFPWEDIDEQWNEIYSC